MVKPTIQQKLLDIGYQLWHGSDMRSTIHQMYNDAHYSVSEDNVRFAICTLLGKLLQTAPNELSSKYINSPTDRLIDIFFSYLIRYYHVTSDGKHYIKSVEKMTEKEIKSLNPWKEVAEKYVGAEFLLSQTNDLVCKSDRKIIEDFNNSLKDKKSKDGYKYHLNIPAYPWYGNPLKANVIVLSLNPGYVERESVVAKAIQNIAERYTEGYTEHLRTMLTLDCGSFLPQDLGLEGMTYRDLANMHQGWYWQDKLMAAFVNDDAKLTFEEVNNRFAVIQYVGYSSKEYKPFPKGVVLPSQLYTRQLIEFILNHRRNTVFIVARNVQAWKNFLGDLWDENRFIHVDSKYSRCQHFTRIILGEESYSKVMNAFKS